MGTINMLGSEEQKQRWLPAMATLDKIGAFALTEPDHGSDSVALETTVRRDGDTLGAQRRQALDRQRAASPTSSSSGRATTDDGQVKAIRRREERRRHLPRRLHRRADHRQDRQARRVAARHHPARRAGAARTTSSPRRTPSATPPACSPRPAAARPGSRSATPSPPTRSLCDYAEDARAVRQADRELPARAAQAGRDARRDHRHAAVSASGWRSCRSRAAGPARWRRWPR